MSGILTFVIQLWLDFPAFVGYLKGQAFKSPLNEKEEALFLQRAAEGDEHAKNELIERNMRLVAHVVKKFHPKHELLDDYISIGTIGLMKAISSFTPEKKTRLATYAARCIENEILMYLRTQKKVQKDVSLYESVGIDLEGRALQIADLLPSNDQDTSEQIEWNDEKTKLYQHLSKLEGREWDIIVRRFGLFGLEEMTQKQIAKELNISRSYVSRIEKRALVHLYQQFKHEKTPSIMENRKSE
ncbi:RNA polymerase sporulation sigma factor SigK [Paenisporosarcina cavernae]|uniref:Sigma-70 family RNA polymerase sigma factor n=1 Tax=Paenisporosarcina cavernae TaxID=2320858 RepID=A0A385YUV2_9BACL|nr:RNA polymerase sporulation sigma factor SigK [Paenisporosarcina cavernae]AYC29697.1 sigma-70 family RNA polymerase sigma factor [Paenisporosarcina cavernae]